MTQGTTTLDAANHGVVIADNLKEGPLTSASTQPSNPKAKRIGVQAGKENFEPRGPDKGAAGFHIGPTVKVKGAHHRTKDSQASPSPELARALVKELDQGSFHDLDFEGGNPSQ